MRLAVELCLPQDAFTLPVVRHITVCALEELGIPPSDVDDVALALTEACTNVVRHSEADEEYEVRLVVEGGVCQITVVDTGRGLASGAAVVRMAPPTAEEGRGLALIAALVDRVRFESRPEEGTVVRLVKRLDIAPDGPRDRLQGLDRA